MHRCIKILKVNLYTISFIKLLTWQNEYIPFIKGWQPICISGSQRISISIMIKCKQPSRKALEDHAKDFITIINIIKHIFYSEANKPVTLKEQHAYSASIFLKQQQILVGCKVINILITSVLNGCFKCQLLPKHG